MTPSTLALICQLLAVLFVGMALYMAHDLARRVRRWQVRDCLARRNWHTEREDLEKTRVRRGGDG